MKTLYQTSYTKNSKFNMKYQYDVQYVRHIVFGVFLYNLFNKVFLF